MGAEERKKMFSLLLVKIMTLYLTVQPEEDYHNKEEGRPKLGQRHHGHCTRIGNKSQAGTCNWYKGDASLFCILINRLHECISSSRTELQLMYYFRFDARLQFGQIISKCDKHYCKVHRGDAVQCTLGCTWFSHCRNVNAQLVGHEAEDREDCKARNKAGRTVHQAQGECISGIRTEKYVYPEASLNRASWIWQICIVLTCSSCCCIYCSFPKLANSRCTQHMRKKSDSQHPSTP